MSRQACLSGFFFERVFAAAILMVPDSAHAASAAEIGSDVDSAVVDKITRIDKKMGRCLEDHVCGAA